MNVRTILFCYFPLYLSPYTYTSIFVIKQSKISSRRSNGYKPTAVVTPEDIIDGSLKSFDTIAAESDSYDQSTIDEYSNTCLHFTHLITENNDSLCHDDSTDISSMEDFCVTKSVAPSISSSKRKNNANEAENIEITDKQLKNIFIYKVTDCIEEENGTFYD